MLSVASMSGVFGYGRPARTAGAAPTSGDSILEFARTLAATYPSGIVAPTAGGALSINSQAVGNFEYAVRPGETVTSSWSEANYFSNTEDTVSSWIVFNGNVIIDATFTSGAPMRPSRRKLFTVVYVTGNLTMNGVLSMSARGANHSGGGNSGGFTAPVDIRLATGSYSQTAPTATSITNPQIPAAGGAGAATRSTAGSTSGTAGAAGGTGGGGGGTWFSAGDTVGTGSDGTCFSGGSGSGSVYTNGSSQSSANGDTNGGAGSDGAQPDVQIGSGGAGNPGGLGYWIGASPPSYLYPTINGGDGTGGVLIVIVEGTLSANAAATRFTANGVAGGTLGGVSGGASGGGSVTVFYKILGTAPGITASSGGNGGAGTARRLLLS
jgi:hypothetical protein